SPAVADLLGRLPADKIEAGRQVAAEIAKLGPGAIGEIAGLIVPQGKGDDVRARFALAGLAFDASRPGAEAERASVAAALAKALDAAAEPEVKTFIAGLLQLCGKDESVPALAKLLPDAALCEPAAQALTTIATPAAGAALAAALPQAKGKAVDTLVRACGALRVKAAVKTILPLATADDPLVRRMALYALANIGDASAAGVLAKAASVESKVERAHATALYLLLARRMAEAGQKDACAKICRDLISGRTDPRENHVVAAALTTLVDALGASAAPDVLAAMDSGHAPLRAAAWRLAEDLPGEAMSRRLVEKMKSAPPDARAAGLAVLARRGDAVARSAVLAALGDGNASVRLAAIAATSRVASPEAAKALLAAVTSADAATAPAAEAALARMPGDDVSAAVAAALGKGSPAAQAALVRVLARRGARAQLDAVFKAAEAEDKTVRRAAIKAVGDLGDGAAVPRLVALMGRPAADAEALRSAIGSIAARTGDAGPVLAALQGAPAAVRPLLLGPLVQAGGEKALAAVVAETKSADAATKDAAIRALADWRDVAAAGALLDIARTAEKPAHQVIALRGYVRLAGIENNRPAAATVKMFTDGLAAAKRPDEQRLALSGLATVRDPAALEAVAAYLDDAALGAEAALAAVRIVLPQKEGDTPLAGDAVLAVMRKVALAAKDAKVRDQAKAYVASAPRPASANLALGKPVAISAEAQGDQKPELAVDGNWIEPYSSYWGDRWPSWIQVDLGKPTKIDTVRIYFWCDSRYYEYTVEISTDGKAWKTVADESKNTKPAVATGATHTFEPAEARYVRVQILKNSANEAVHVVELQVFAPGTAPKDPGPPPPAPLAPADAEGFHPLFNGRDLTGWIGATRGYVAENGTIVCLKEGGGNLYADREFSDFHLKFEFLLTPGANNGLGIRTPMGVDAAYAGMELQVLDDTADVYKSLQPYQYHGSIYGVAACKRGHQKPVGEWNTQEVIADGPKIKVILNGETIVDADLSTITKTADGHDHPGLHNAKGYIGFLGHGSRVEFRNIRIKELTK
ncbi:MAG: DUF1080 domain-containing protein, partial [Planctomycetes bacterium]|nr:DUF1080 domain-containing protein [Planctomycetota bacterium]